MASATCWMQSRTMPARDSAGRSRSTSIPT
nr:MAG TPA: hypothetical protein [Caudoviricetes sp.]